MKVSIHAKQFWNHTGILLEAGISYRFAAEGVWIDWNINYGPDGGGSGSNLLLIVSEKLRRRPNDNWFALIGGFGEDESSTFLIGSSNSGFTAPRSGELTCFANDVPVAYFNNKGSVTLTVEPIP